MTITVQCNTVSYGGLTLQTSERYKDKNSTAAKPGVLMIIGGGFAEATPTKRAKWDGECRKLVQAGYAALTISYRGHPNAFIMDTMEDVRLAAAWFASRPFVDGSRICAWGRSAGAFMAARLGVEELVKCVMAECGPLGVETPGEQTTEWLNGADPLVEFPRFRVTPTTAPMMLVHGTTDTVVPYQESIDMKATLDAAGVPATLRLHSGGHGKLPAGSVGASVWNDQMAWLRTAL